MAEVAWDNNCKTCKAMVTVIAAILMLVVVLMLRLVLQCPITGKLLVAMMFDSRRTSSMALCDFIVFIFSKRM